MFNVLLVSTTVAADDIAENDVAVDLFMLVE
jgi:hypothetical protein